MASLWLCGGGPYPATPLPHLLIPSAAMTGGPTATTEEAAAVPVAAPSDAAGIEKPSPGETHWPGGGDAVSGTK